MHTVELVIGFTAVVVGMLYRFPQIVRIYRRKSADDISLIMYGIQMVSYILYLIYGFMIGDLVYIISSIVAMLQNLVIMGMYYLYRPVSENKENTENIDALNIV